MNVNTRDPRNSGLLVFTILAVVFITMFTFGCTSPNSNHVVKKITGGMGGETTSDKVSLSEITGFRADSIVSNYKGKRVNVIYVIFKSGDSELPASALPDKLDMKAHLVVYASVYNASVSKRIPTRKVYEGDFTITHACISSTDLRNKECYIHVPFKDMGVRSNNESLAGIFNLTIRLPSGKSASDLGYTITIPSENNK